VVRLYKSLGLLVAVGLVSPVLGSQFTSTSHLGTYEDILFPNDTVNSFHTFTSQNGQGELQHMYPPAVHTSSNTSAYVNPFTGVMRVMAESNTFHENIAAEGGTPPPPHMDRTRAGADVNYVHRLLIGAGSSGKQVGDPVQLQVTFHLDGFLNMAIPRPDAGKIHNMIDMNAHFLVIDNAISGETGNPEMVSFNASAHREQYETVPGEEGYPIDGATYYNHDYKWSLGSNDPAFAAQSFRDREDKELPYNWNASGASEVPYHAVKQFDTGTLVATFDTYVGAELDVNAALGVDCFSYSNFQTQASRADFSNTFALNFTPAPGFEGLSVVTTAVVPEPGAISVLAFACSLTLRRRVR
jgi:hypothetical protein